MTSTQSTGITPGTAREIADVLDRYLTAEQRLVTAKDDDVVSAAAEWVDAGEEVRALREQAFNERKAFELAEKQGGIFAQNLAWLKRHHPDDPRIPQIEASLAGGL